jgi:hypothetical protein
MKVRYITKYEVAVEEIECEDLQVFNHSSECCAIKFLGEETGKNEDGVTVRKVIKVVFGVTEYSF